MVLILTWILRSLIYSETLQTVCLRDLSYEGLEWYILGTFYQGTTQGYRRPCVPNKATLEASWPMDHTETLMEVSNIGFIVAPERGTEIEWSYSWHNLNRLSCQWAQGRAHVMYTNISWWREASANIWTECRSPVCNTMMKFEITTPLVPNIDCNTFPPMNTTINVLWGFSHLFCICIWQSQHSAVHKVFVNGSDHLSVSKISTMPGLYGHML